MLLAGHVRTLLLGATRVTINREPPAGRADALQFKAALVPTAGVHLKKIIRQFLRDASVATGAIGSWRADHETSSISASGRCFIAHSRTLCRVASAKYCDTNGLALDYCT
jgi:hypothetical protein